MQGSSSKHTLSFSASIDIPRIALIVGEAGWVNSVIRVDFPEDRLLIKCEVEGGEIATLIELKKPQKDFVQLRVVRNVHIQSCSDGVTRSKGLLQSLRRMVEAADRH